MAAKRSLRVATEEDAPKKLLSLTEAIEAGNYLEILRAQRREAVRDLRDMNGPAKAAMHRQIALLGKEIAALEASQLDGEDSVAATTDDEAWDGTGY